MEVPFIAVDWVEVRKLLVGQLASELRLKRGVPRRLLQEFVKETTTWLSLGSPRTDLPLFSHDTLRDIVLGKKKERHRPSPKNSSVSEQRTAGTITAALTELAKRLRARPQTSVADRTPETILVSVDLSVDGERLRVDLTGPLQKHRAGIGFPDDPGVGFLARVSSTEKPGVATTAASSLSVADAAVLSRLLDLPTRIEEKLSATQPLRSPNEVPSPSRDFTGRDDELLELLDAHDSRASSILGVQGPSGVGKTALGLALVDRLRPRYQSTIFLDLRGNTEEPLTPSDVMRHVIHAYQPGRSLPDDLDALRGMYQSTLHDGNAILFFDNAANAAQLQPLLPQKDSLLVVTSLRRFASPGMYPVHLLPLNSVAARDFLITLAPRCASQGDDLARLCGYFPIALRAAGHALAEYPNITVENYLERLRAAQARLALVDPTTERSVEAVLDVGYALLPEDLQQRFDALAIFPATFRSASAAAVWRLPSDATEESLGTLLRMSFIEYDANTDRYYLHDLLRLFAGAQLRPSVREQLDRRFARHMRTVLYVQPWISTATAVERNAARRLALEWPNIEQVYRWVTAKPEGDAFAARFLAMFQWPRYFISPMDRASMLLWLERGTRETNSRWQRRFVSLNIERKALYYANSRDFVEAVQELGRLPTLFEALRSPPDMEYLLPTLQAIAIGDSEAREIVLSFLLPYTRSGAASIVQAQLLATVATIQGGMGLHAEAVSNFDRAATMARDIEPNGALAILLPATACAEALDNNDMDLAAAHADDLLQVSGSDHRRMTTLLLGRLAPVVAARGDAARADRLYDLYITRSQDSSFIPERSRTLTNAAKAWYLASLLVARSAGDRGAEYERRAIDLLETARQVARERNDLESEEYAAVPLGLIHASRKSFRRARAFLSASLYREITRNGGEGLQSVLSRVFSDFSE